MEHLARLSFIKVFSRTTSCFLGILLGKSRILIRKQVYWETEEQHNLHSYVMHLITSLTFERALSPQFQLLSKLSYLSMFSVEENAITFLSWKYGYLTWDCIRSTILQEKKKTNRGYHVFQSHYLVQAIS